MGKKEKRPEWFKVNIAIARKICEMDPSDVGKATQAAAALFANGEEASNELLSYPEAFKLYALYENSINTAYCEYSEAVENGRRGQAEKQKNAAMDNNKTP